MSYIHKELAGGRWFKFSFFEQMANIGSEVERTISWRNENTEHSKAAFERGLELLDLTIIDPKNKKRLKELCRLREVLVDYFCFDNTYGSTDQNMSNYFYSFNYAVAINRERFGGVV